MLVPLYLKIIEPDVLSHQFERSWYSYGTGNGVTEDNAEKLVCQTSQVIIHHEK